MFNNMLKGRVVLITDASSGIFLATAQYLSCQGAKLVTTGRNEEQLNETLAFLSDQAHVAISANLTSENSIQHFMEQVFIAVGPLDGLVYCAGIQKTFPLQALKNIHFDEKYFINVKGAHLLTKHFRKKGRYNPSGASIIFLSSVAANCGVPAISTYSASKAALQGLSKSLSIEMARNNIRVNCIAPRYVKTEMSIAFSNNLIEEQLSKNALKHPLGLGQPKDVAYAAVFLSNNLSRWITGTTLFVDGGYSAH